MSNLVVLHISGLDRPGITHKLTQIIAEESATLVDIGQSVLHGFLILSAIVDIPPGSDALQKILLSVSKESFKLEASPFENPEEIPKNGATEDSYCLTLLGPMSDGKALAKISEVLARRKINIQEIRRLSDECFNCLEFTLYSPAMNYNELQAEFFKLATELQIDLAIQRNNVFRRNKRMICMDVDSTLLSAEVIDELGNLVGAGEKIAQITERAMQGEINFTDALHERVKLLKGLPLQKAQEHLDKIPLNPGAERLIGHLKKLGLRIGLLSGGFDFFVDKLKDKYNLDFAFANKLEIENDTITGRVSGTVVDGNRKAQLLDDMAQAYACPRLQSIAVGDGANDILMLQNAGLGVAYQAKKKLRDQSDTQLDQSPLDSLLHLMGYSSLDLNLLDKDL